MQRTYDVVVWGASGFVGKLVCEHFAKHYQSFGQVHSAKHGGNLGHLVHVAFVVRTGAVTVANTGKVKWAMAGRTKEKLETHKDELIKINDQVKDVPFILADIKDEESLLNMTKSTSVVISTVGPYAKLGRPVVKACVDTATHYCDLTGEPQFIRRCIDEFHEKAEANGTRIVHCCGYDSVPSEWGSLMCIDHLKNKHGLKPKEVFMLVKDTKGGVSGGTIDSGIGVLKEDKSVLKQMGHPYYLVPEKAAVDKKELPDQGEYNAPKYHNAAKSWSGPFVMSPVNSAVVRRSNALLDYGEDMTYTDRMKGSGWLGAAAVTGMHVTIGALLFAASRSNFVRNRLPIAGSGPSRDTMNNGYWHHEAYAVGESTDSKDAVVVRAKYGDKHGDGGYLSTSKMLSEAALCLALDQDKIAKDPYASKHAGGVLTPSSAMGLVYHQRLLDKEYYAEVDTVQDP